MTYLSISIRVEVDEHLVEVLLKRFLRDLARVVVQPVPVVIVRQTVVVHTEHLQHVDGLVASGGPKIPQIPFALVDCNHSNGNSVHVYH